MQLRPDQLAQHLERGPLRPIYTVHGDEALLAQEAGDLIRAAARDAGCSERQVFTVSGAHFDWSGVLGAAQAMSLFAERRLIEIRIPGGKPGKDGSEYLQRYCERLPEDVITLVQLPRLDGQQLKSGWFAALDGAGVSLRIETIERPALPQWIVRRLALQRQRVKEGEEGQRTLAFFADRIEGNLLAAHQELQKLALLYPEGELSFDDVAAAVLDVARYDVFKLGEAMLTGQTARALRMLDGLRAEGESPVRVLWTLADDLRALRRVRLALDAGRPLPLALQDARTWGAKLKLVERAAPALATRDVLRLVQAASVCDGLSKGLKHPHWPLEPWEGLRRLVLMVIEALAASSPPPRGRPRATLALEA